jgi:SAM-dependent methyltransferase
MAAIVDTEQARAWNGYEGRHWANNQDRWDAINAGVNQPLFTAAAITANDRVLDIGCGNGYTTRRAARHAAHGHATGIDLSEPMLERARAAAAEEPISNINFEQGDAQTCTFPNGAFDLAISRYGVMFFADPAVAFTNIGHAFRPGGRLTFICAADPNDSDWFRAVSALRDHLPVPEFGPGGPGMFSLADPDQIRRVLTTAGFRDITTTAVQAEATWGRDAEDVANFLLHSGPGQFMLGNAAPATAAVARHALTEALRTYQQPGRALHLRSTAWLVTARTS